MASPAVVDIEEIGDPHRVTPWPWVFAARDGPHAAAVEEALFNRTLFAAVEEFIGHARTSLI